MCFESAFKGYNDDIIYGLYYQCHQNFLFRTKIILDHMTYS